MVGIISAVKRMQREAVAWEEKRPSTENTVMAVSLRSEGEEGQASVLMDYVYRVQFLYFSFSGDISWCPFSIELILIQKWWISPTNLSLNFARLLLLTEDTDSSVGSLWEEVSAAAPSAFDAWLKHSAWHSFDFAATAVSYIKWLLYSLLATRGRLRLKQRQVCFHTRLWQDKGTQHVLFHSQSWTVYFSWSMKHI